MSRKAIPDSDDDAAESADRIRLDKWLWAARFYKTRSLAAEAIGGGKVEVNGEHVKRARLVQVGDLVRLRLGPYEHAVQVRRISGRRGPAPEAATLYEETAESRAARERLAAQHRLASAGVSYDKGRPTKKDRRDIERFRDRGR